MDTERCAECGLTEPGSLINPVNGYRRVHLIAPLGPPYAAGYPNGTAPTHTFLPQKRRPQPVPDSSLTVKVPR